jgi:hypothetical protein
MSVVTNREKRGSLAYLRNTKEEDSDEVVGEG